eukprot:gene19645-26331_t
MDFVQRMNAVMRFSVYFAVVMIVLTSNMKYVLVPVVVAIITYLLHQRMPQSTGPTLKDGQVYDKFAERGCTAPSNNNPFMNVLMNEYVDAPDRLRACDVEDNKVRKLVNKHFDENLPRNVDDIFNKQASDRQYYTTPNTQIPNDQESFVKWLYGGAKTCKENNGVACARNIGI